MLFFLLYLAFGLISIIIKEKYEDKIKRAGLIVFLLAILPVGINVMDLIASRNYYEFSHRTWNNSNSYINMFSI